MEQTRDKFKIRYNRCMSFQAYIDNIYTKTHMTPEDFLKAAKAKGMVGPDVKVMEIVTWLKAEYGLGHGHAMAIVLTFRKAGAIPPKK
jgi:Domain of unknown function (DUF4287)